jgi:hypothetical protein
MTSTCAKQSRRAIGTLAASLRFHKPYPPIQPSKAMDQTAFVQYRLVAMISESNVPEKDNFVSLIHLDGNSTAAVFAS